MDQLSVRVGSSNKTSGGSVFQLKRMIIHPNYEVASTDYDFGLLELANLLKFSDKIKPIALPSADFEIDDETICVTSGWGKKSLNQLMK